MAWVRDISLKQGFKALCPYNDTSNKLYTCITMMCALCGSLTLKKNSTNCPFKLTYIKLHHELNYRLVGFPQSFVHHNHSLPIEGVFINGKPQPNFVPVPPFNGGEKNMMMS